MEKLSFFRAVYYDPLGGSQSTSYFEKGIDKVESYFDLSPLKARVSLKHIESGVDGIDYFRDSSPSFARLILKISAQACIIFPVLALLAPSLLPSSLILSVTGCVIGSFSLVLLVIKILFRTTHHFRTLDPKEFVLKCLKENEIEKAQTYIRSMKKGEEQQHLALQLIENLHEKVTPQERLHVVKLIDDPNARDVFLIKWISDLKDMVKPDILFHFIQKISHSSERDRHLVLLAQQFYNDGIQEKIIIANHMSDPHNKKEFVHQICDKHRNQPEKLLVQLSQLNTEYSVLAYKRMAENYLDDSSPNLFFAEKALEKSGKHRPSLDLQLAKKYLELDNPEKALEITLKYLYVDSFLIKIAHSFFEKNNLEKTSEIILKTKCSFQEQDALIIQLVDRLIDIKDSLNAHKIIKKMADQHKKEIALKKLIEFHFEKREFKECFLALQDATDESTIQEQSRKIFKRICEEKTGKEVFDWIQQMDKDSFFKPELHFLKKEFLIEIKKNVLKEGDLKLAFKIFRTIVKAEYEKKEVQEEEIERCLREEGQFILDSLENSYAGDRLDECLKILPYLFDKESQTKYLAKIYKKNPKENLFIIQAVFGIKNSCIQLAHYFYREGEVVTALKILEKAFLRDSFKKALCEKIKNKFSNPEKLLSKITKEGASELIPFFCEEERKNYDDKEKRKNALDFVEQFLNQETLEFFWDFLQPSRESSKGFYDAIFALECAFFLDKGLFRKAVESADKIQDKKKKNQLLSEILLEVIPEQDLALEILVKISKSFFLSHIKKISKKLFKKYGYKKCSEIGQKIENKVKFLAFSREIKNLNLIDLVENG